MNTLLVVEEILRAANRPLSTREIVKLAGPNLPTTSYRPENVVARDLSVDIKKRPRKSKFVRTSPGRYTMKDYVE